MADFNCIEFEGCKDPKTGYGRKSRSGKSYLAHRLAYVDAHGLDISDIDEVVIRHTCDNPPCIEPSHLIAGTVADNMQDMHDRGRHWNLAKDSCSNCEGEYKTKKGGGRYCPACQNAWARRKRASKKVSA